MFLFKNTVLVCITLVFFLSCSVQKRKYQKGYFVEWQSRSPQSEKKENPLSACKKQDPEGSFASFHLQEKKQQQTPPVVTNTAMEIGGPSTPTLIFQVSPEDSCDVLIYKDGSEAAVRLLEISSLQIKYKKCAIPEGPVYISNKSELFMIRFANGSKEVIGSETSAVKERAPVLVDNSTQPKSPTWLATSAFVFSLIGLYPVLFPASIAGLIMAIIQIKRIEAEPDKYAGLRKSKAAIVFAIIGLYLSFLVYFLMIAGRL